MQQTFAGKFISTRRGAIFVGVGAAILAGLLLLAYLNSYRDSIKSETAPAGVLVAKRLIVAGTSGTVIAERKLFETTTIAEKDVKLGAIADPAFINGRVVATDIFPGQQLTTTDFSTETTNAIVTKLTGRQRALSIPIDQIHGSLSEVRVGDRVDIYVALTQQRGGAGGASVVKLFRPNVLVMSTGAALATGNGNGGNVILRIPSKDAAAYALIADTASFWFALRPQVGAKPTPPSTATAQSILR